MNYQYYQHKRDLAQADKEDQYKLFSKLAYKAYQVVSPLALAYLLIDLMLRANGF